MRFVLAILLFFQATLWGIPPDFDVTVVGTSPISLLEAIYHMYQGKSVLILEADARCGGAWKAIDICGIEHADLGCHLIGSDARLRVFFENHFGCEFLCLEHPAEKPIGMHAHCPYGFYFSQGCYELISKLTETINKFSTTHLVHQKLERIYVDKEKGCVALTIGNDENTYTTHQLIITPVTHFQIENPGFVNPNYGQHPYHHLYMLIEDETPARFTYLNGIAPGMARAMNLTPFLDMPRDNLQLIVVQTYGNQNADQQNVFIEAFKNKEYLTPNAHVIRADHFVYHQTFVNTSQIQQIGESLIEVLDTSSFAGMTRHIDKWASVLPAYAP